MPNIKLLTGELSDTVCRIQLIVQEHSNIKKLNNKLCEISDKRHPKKSPYAYSRAINLPEIGSGAETLKEKTQYNV